MLHPAAEPKTLGFLIPCPFFLAKARSHSGGAGGMFQGNLDSQLSQGRGGPTPCFSALSCQLTILVLLPLESCFYVFAPWDSEFYHEIIREVDIISVGNLSCWHKSNLTFQSPHTPSTAQSGHKAILGQPTVRAPTHNSCLCSSAA